MLCFRLVNSRVLPQFTADKVVVEEEMLTLNDIKQHLVDVMPSYTGYEMFP